MAISSPETKDTAAAAKTGATLVDQAKGKIQELASSAAQTLEGAAATVSHKAQDWAANVGHKAQSTASAAVDMTNEGIAAVGQRMSSLGDTVQKTAVDMGKDATSLIRQYPIQAVLLSFGLGCLLGMTMRRN